MHFASDGCSLISTSHVMLLYAETDNILPYHTRAGEPGGFPTQSAGRRLHHQIAAVYVN